MDHLATRQRGFTLIEVMIVVAVVALLAGIALPSYQEYVRRTHRAHAQATLVQAAQWMERAATVRGSYPVTNQIPADLLQVEGGRYTVVAVSDGATYTLTAIPTAGQATDPCAAYRLTETGRRSQENVSSHTPSLSVDACWDR
ncbi:MAG: type IV pilin protein [Hydrogenophaga sp.]|jgi:type IV pilus assembly protein PilE|uniref:type IV pilin protein n=1 Tax=Hydrogenophaga sp. TaxID=1904254 RepID=UPI00263237ED|nr:type IV pilin protein [Hydrogenophaga sp.]MCV0438657.1 type IV pilin protein [Hydrogenophaga sp.]